jgi:hypothetical protein
MSKSGDRIIPKIVNEKKRGFRLYITGAAVSQSILMGR